jgi:hypothetical protein
MLEPIPPPKQRIRPHRLRYTLKIATHPVRLTYALTVAAHPVRLNRVERGSCRM